MEKVKCDCGHVNPHGTIFCEACGKPQEDLENDKKLLNMRYEGSARRSQTYNQTFIDKIWNFFSSVKVGVWLIVITLIASALGTIFPQEMYIPPTVSPAEFYEEEYGFLGQLYYQLGFNNLYGSWWYMILIASIAISLVICSLDRVVPLYKALKRQRVTRHTSFLQRQRIFGTSPIPSEDGFLKIKDMLKQKNYRVREEDGNILAEKGRFSRWGPYVNHIGLIIFLIGGMLRFFPGMYIDEVMWLREGETKVVPGTEGRLYLENHQFILDVYDEENAKFKEALENVGGMIAKNYQSNVTLYERQGKIIPGKDPKLVKVKDEEIRVNHPLKFDGYAFYQVDYKLNELSQMSFTLENKETGESYGEININLEEPKPSYDLGNGYRVEIMNYFPDFYFDDNGDPATKTKLPNNPAFIFNMFTPETPKGEVSFVAIRSNLEPLGENKYKMSFSNVKTRHATALTIRRDYTLGIIAVGGFIFMFGVIQGMYWNHRRIWLQRHGNDIWVAAHTNKNWYGLKRDIEKVIEDTGVSMPDDQLEKDEMKQIS